MLDLPRAPGTQHAVIGEGELAVADVAIARCAVVDIVQLVVTESHAQLYPGDWRERWASVGADGPLSVMRLPQRQSPLDIIAGNDDDLFMRYPGGKGKCYQQIINLLPPHETYIETHLGGGAVLRYKKPARVSVGIDRDVAVIRRWETQFPFLASYVAGDAYEFLASSSFRGDEVIYCDPPYVPTTRRRTRVYRYDYSEGDHVQLIGLLRNLPSRILISGYDSDLYEELLHDWNTQTFSAKAQDGIRFEKLWFNFEPPVRLHDPRYLGRDFRERQTLGRRLERLQRRISALSLQEQSRLCEWLDHQLTEKASNAGLLLSES